MRNIVTYDTHHGSAKKLAEIIARKLDCLCVNVDTPFQAEDESKYDNLIIVFGFRGPYTAQLTKLFIERMKTKLNYKNLIVVGEGLFSEKEFPSVAEGLKVTAKPYTFNSFFMYGELRVETLTPEEKALLAKFSELTGMEIKDMGEFDLKSAEDIADKIYKLVSELPVPLDPNAGKTRWICPVCGYVHTGDEPPLKCPVCGKPGSLFKVLSTPTPNNPYEGRVDEELKLEVKVEKKTKTYKCLLCGKVFMVEEGEEPVCPGCGAKGEALQLIG